MSASSNNWTQSAEKFAAMTRREPAAFPGGLRSGSFPARCRRLAL